MDAMTNETVTEEIQYIVIRLGEGSLPEPLLHAD